MNRGPPSRVWKSRQLTSDWVIQDVGDFNADGKADILWRNSTTGEVVIWLMNGTTMTSSTSLGNVSSDWSIAGVGDFNGDGYADILWQNTSGELYLWLMNGTTIAAGENQQRLLRMERCGHWRFSMATAMPTSCGEHHHRPGLRLAHERDHDWEHGQSWHSDFGLEHCGRGRFRWGWQE